MAAQEHFDEDPADLSRREFIGSATLTTAGAVTALSAYLLPAEKPSPPNLEKYKNPENQVRLGYIGVGNRGLALMRSSLQAPGNFPVAVCDTRRSQVDAAVKDIREAKGDPKYKIATYDDYRRLLDDKNVEAVFIATPHYLHGPMTLDAIEAGKNVYCEKAMAYTIEENRDVYNLVKAHPKQVFQVGHQRHYSPLYREVKRLIDEDTIGDVAAIRAQWNKNDVLRRTCPDPALEKIINWRLYSEFSGGLTTEFASHQIDVANWMFGTHPDSVCGYGGVDWFPDGRDTTDNIHLVFNYKVPVLERDKYERVVKDSTGKPVCKKTAGGKTAYRNVRFMYQSIMENGLLKPSELIMGRYGSLEVSLLGGESFKEKKTRPDPAKGEVAKPAVKAAASKVDLSEGGLPRRMGDAIVVPEDPNHWVHFTQPIAGAYDKEETLLAVGSYIEAVRLARAGKPFDRELKANVTYGLWGAVPALMANIAMREERTVYWKEFFGDEPA